MTLLAEGQSDIFTGDDKSNLTGWDWNNTKFIDLGNERDISQDRNCWVLL